MNCTGSPDWPRDVSVELYTLVRVTGFDNADHTICYPKTGSYMTAVAALSIGLTSTPELSQFLATTIPKSYVFKIHITLFAQLLSDYPSPCFAISAPCKISQAFLYL
jgi:hypothetical protein